MKLFAYALREYDELGFMEECSHELGFDFEWTSDYPSLENAELARGCDALCIITNPLDAKLLDRFHELGVRNVATRSIGYDHIDVAHAYELGMRVGHAAYPPEGVANYAIMLMMMGLRKAGLIIQQANVQDYSLRGKLGRDISSCTVGVIGTGKIGATVVRHLQGFGCRVLANDPYPKDDLEGLATYVDLDTLLAESDVITLHAPALESNYHMIDAQALAKAKRGVVIVNAARGALIDTAALLDALESGQVGGAALDTIEHEDNLCYVDHTREVLPNRDRALLEALPNVIVSPHMAFYTATDVRGMVYSSCSALDSFSKGQDSPYEVPRP